MPWSLGQRSDSKESKEKVGLFTKNGGVDFQSQHNNSFSHIRPNRGNMSESYYKFAPGYQGCRKQVNIEYSNEYGNLSQDFDWFKRAEPQYFDTKFKTQERFNVQDNCGWKINKKNYKYQNANPNGKDKLRSSDRSHLNFYGGTYLVASTEINMNTPGRFHSNMSQLYKRRK